MSIPKTNFDCYLLVNNEKISKKLIDLGYDNVICCSLDRISDEDFWELNQARKAVCIIWFDPAESVETCKHEYWKLYDAGIIVGNIDQRTHFKKEKDEKIASAEMYSDRIKENRGLIDGYINRLVNILYHKYKWQCRNCKNEMEKGAKYCQWCGTRAGNGVFQPHDNEVQGLYGSWYVMKVKCSNCGNEWSSSGTAGHIKMFCRECGGEGKALSSDSLDVIFPDVKNT